MVERSPEKAGVGGSTPSLATIISKQLTSLFIFRITRSCPHYCTKPVTGAVFSRFLTGSGSAAFLPRNSNSRNIPLGFELVFGHRLRVDFKGRLPILVPKHFLHQLRIDLQFDQDRSERPSEPWNPKVRGGATTPAFLAATRR